MSQELTIQDLKEILSVLENFGKKKWEEFGLEAGLYKPTLSNIAADHMSALGVGKCFIECLSAWLEMKDNVKKEGVPTWLRLADIMEKLKDKAIADSIRSNKGLAQTSMQNMSNNSSSTVDGGTELVITISVEFTEQYFKMKTDFSILLNSAIDEILKTKSLEDIKRIILAIESCDDNERKEAIDQAKDKDQLVSLFREYCFLTNLGVLKSFVEKFNLKDTEKKIKDFEVQRAKLYEETLALVFATNAIEDHPRGSQSEITFKVRWKCQDTTLWEFEEFLTAAFESRHPFIALRVIRQSLLTFVCTIPNWLVEEMIEYVTKYKDFIISQGVFEVTINDSLIITMKEKGYAALSFYEPNGMMFFTVAPSKKLNELLKFISEHHQFAEVGPIYFYNFKWSHGFIELKFDETLPTGWSIIPTDAPCRLYQDDIDKFDGTSLSSSCMISVHGLPDPTTEPVLHYPVPLEGVLDPVILFIHKVLQSTIPVAPTVPYTGLVYYELKEDNAFTMTFTAAKNIEALVKYIETHHPLAKINQLVHFDFDSSCNHIELNFDFPQESPSTGWSIELHGKIYKNDIDNFDEAVFPPSCLVSVYESPNAVSSLHYSLLLVGVADPVTLYIESTSKPTAILSQDDMSYIGLVYYEWKGKEYFMTFTAAKKLSKLLEFIEEYHPLAEVDQIINFTFSSPHGFIELIFDDPEDDDSYKGWTVQPLVRPCRLYQEDVYNFGEANYPLPPSCLVSVYGSPGAVPSLHYSVRLVGVADPVSLYINRKLLLENHIHNLQVKVEKLKEEGRRKDGEIAFSTKKMHDSLEKQSKMAKEKQELSEKLVTLINERKLDKQPEFSKLLDYEVSKLEVVLQPMEDIWFQLGHHLNVEVSLLSDIEQTKDTNEQMRSLLQLCSDRGVTMMQLEEALVALDRKSLIPGLHDLSKECLSSNEKERMEQKEFEFELQETKAVLEAYKSEQQELKAAKEMLKIDISLKDKTIADLVKEKSQLMEKEKETFKHIDLTSQLKEMESVIDKILSEQQGIMLKNEDLKETLTEIDNIASELLTTEELEKKLQRCIDSLHQKLTLENEEPVQELLDEDLVTQLQEVMDIFNKELMPVTEWKATFETLLKKDEMQELSTHDLKAKLQQTKAIIVNVMQQQLLTTSDIKKQLQETNTRAISVHKQLIVEGNNLKYKVTENKSLLQQALLSPRVHVKDPTAYVGLVYYEEKGVEDLVTFTVAKDLDALLQFIDQRHSNAEIGQNVYFRFGLDNEYIELDFNSPQKKPFTGWNIIPHMKPCQFYQDDVNRFGECNYSIPPSCLISVYGSPGAVPSLHYAVPLVGVDRPVTLYIHRSLRTIPHSLTIPEAAASSSTGGASASATIDVKKVKKVIEDVLVSLYDVLTFLPKKALPDLADQLYVVRLINNAVRESPLMEEFIDEFKAGLTFLFEMADIQEHCQKFLKSFVAVRGSFAGAAKFLRKKWIEALRTELGFDFKIELDA